MAIVGLLLLVVGVVLLAFEAHVPLAGVAAATGALTLVAGVALAVGAWGGLALGIGLAAMLAVVLAALLAVVGRRLVEPRRRLPRAAAAGLVGRRGTVRSWSPGGGRVFVAGALWRARDEQAEDLRAGDPVIVDEVSGLTLAVHKADALELVS